MNNLLTVLLPVHNGQQWLRRKVAAILDVLEDGREPFELVIVDAGSDDATEEVVAELATSFPQVRGLRLAEPLSPGVAADEARTLLGERRYLECPALGDFDPTPAARDDSPYGRLVRWDRQLSDLAARRRRRRRRPTELRI